MKINHSYLDVIFNLANGCFETYGAEQRVVAGSFLRENALEKYNFREARCSHIARKIQHRHVSGARRLEQ